MKTWLLTAALIATGLTARAAQPEQILDGDPLSRQILSKTVQEKNGGVTAAVRLASGQVIELKLPDISSAPFAAPLAPASEAALAGLHPVEGLAPKAEKPQPKKTVKKAIDQLKHAAAGKTWAEKR